VYDTAAAFRHAIEARLNQRASEDGVEVNRVRRGFVFERIMARLEVADPGAWVVKGGMALEWRLGKRARGTRDLDLVLRGHAVRGAELRDRLIDLLAVIDLDLVRPAQVLCGRSPRLREPGHARRARGAAGPACELERGLCASG